MSECPCSESSHYKEPPRLLENKRGGNVFWGQRRVGWRKQMRLQRLTAELSALQFLAGVSAPSFLALKARGDPRSRRFNS